MVEVHKTLTAGGLAHAFGGALALAYVAEPRGTVDVDLNVFTSIEEADAVLVVFKLSFGRDKDWVDLRSIASANADLDIDYVERQATSLRGPAMFPRVVRLRRILREAQRTT